MKKRGPPTTPISVRVGATLVEYIKQEAIRNKRSLTKEIEFRLDKSAAEEIRERAE